MYFEPLLKATDCHLVLKTFVLVCILAAAPKISTVKPLRLNVLGHSLGLHKFMWCLGCSIQLKGHDETLQGLLERNAK